MSTTRIELRGTTWHHARGFLPMVATAQRFTELHPEIEITWERRSLKAFEDYPVEQLAAQFDLIVLDHPSISQGARHGALLPLDEHLPAAFLADQAGHAVGRSFESYRYHNHQWSLATDAATPIACWRDDLLTAVGRPRPQTWAETIQLAKTGAVEMPAAPINCLMNFYSLCVAAGEAPFTHADRVVSRAVGRAAIAQLRALLAWCDPGCWDRNPIGSHERLAAADNRTLLYCPLAYGYSNYARPGYAAHPLTSGEPPLVDGTPLQTTLGGAGLAVSAQTRHRAAAVAYAAFVAAPETQRTLYTHAGGQPGDRRAWIDPENNRITGGYFSATLPALERAFLRPQYAGYLKFQDHAGPLLHLALQGRAAETATLDAMDALYRDTLASHSHAA